MSARKRKKEKREHRLSIGFREETYIGINLYREEKRLATMSDAGRVIIEEALDKRNSLSGNTELQTNE